MNEVIKVNYDSEQMTVSARDLYDVVSSDGGVKGTERFSKWFERYCSYGFTEGIDYSTPNKKVRVQTEGNREVQREVDDYDLSVDMAKQICMLQRTEKGKEIRQYLLNLEKSWNTPEQVMARALKMADKTIEKLKNQNLELETTIQRMDRVINELTPKAGYVDVILKSPSTVLTTQIAQDYGISARTLNKKLSDFRIQRKVGGQWILYAEYQGKGYVHSKTIDIVRSNGQPDVRMQTEWTQKGRLFLYEELKRHGIYPMVERTEGER